MASAHGGQQEPAGSQLAVPYGPPVPDGGQQMGQDPLESFPHDEGQEEPVGSQLAVPHGPQVPGGGQQMPEHFSIGTQKAFDRNEPFEYWKKQINSEIIYVCTKGSEWARAGEVLVLRCDLLGTWTAFDSAVSADGLTLQCRQPVFRCLATDITQPGWHNWEMNYSAGPNDPCLAADWQGELWAETRVP